MRAGDADPHRSRARRRVCGQRTETTRADHARRRRAPAVHQPRRRRPAHATIATAGHFIQEIAAWAGAPASGVALCTLQGQTIQDWELQSGRTRSTLRDSADRTSIALFPDGRRALLAWFDLRSLVRDLESDPAPFVRHRGGTPQSRAATPDGRHPVLALSDHTLGISVSWDCTLRV